MSLKTGLTPQPNLYVSPAGIAADAAVKMPRNLQCYLYLIESNTVRSPSIAAH